MVVNTVMSVLYLVAVPTIIAGAFESPNGAENSADGFLFLALISLILAIVTLVKDKKIGFRIVSSVLAIVGHSIYLLFGAVIFLPAMVLTIISAVFYGIDSSKKKELIQGGISMGKRYELVKVRVAEPVIDSDWFERFGEEYWAIKDNTEIAAGWDQPYGIIMHLFSKEDVEAELEKWNEKGYPVLTDNENIVDEWAITSEVIFEEVQKWQ